MLAGEEMKAGTDDLHQNVRRYEFLKAGFPVHPSELAATRGLLATSYLPVMLVLVALVRLIRR